MPFIESSEFFRIAVRRGAAIVQIAVTSPVVIKTTSTHPGTSPRSSLRRAKKLCWIDVSFRRKFNSATNARSKSLLIFSSFSVVAGLLIYLTPDLIDIFFPKKIALRETD
jgi:hypothetical protein